MLPFVLPPPPPGYGIVTHIRLAERPLLEARESILRYGHQRLGHPDTDINIQVRVHRTVLCCQSPFLMSEDGGDTVIILSDVEVDAMFSVLDVIYRGQRSASTDYDKFQLTRLLLRLGLDRVARSLSLQQVTVSEVRDENLNNLVNTKPPEDIKDPTTIQPPAQTQPPPDIINPGISPGQRVTSGKVGEVFVLICSVYSSFLFFLDRVSLEPVLESHLLSQHFRQPIIIIMSRPECEAAILEILVRTGGKCPLCPATRAEPGARRATGPRD